MATSSGSTTRARTERPPSHCEDFKCTTLDFRALLIDCQTSDVDAAARFWATALGRPVDPKHPGTRGNYVMLETPPDEPIVQIQRVEHESRVHLDIETDDIPAEVARLEQLGASVVNRLERWVVMQSPTGQRFCVVRIQRPGFPKNAHRWE